MPQKVYIVDLTKDERSELRGLISKGNPSARKVARAHILLLADEGATDKAIAASLYVGKATVERTRKRFVEGNLDRALNEDPRPGAKRKLDDKQEAFLIATARSTKRGHQTDDRSVGGAWSRNCGRSDGRWKRGL